MFTSDNSALGAANGQQNAGKRQYYRYDDVSRSLVCVSCPADGGVPRGPVPTAVGDGGPNLTPITDDGDIAFATPTPLVSADQNTGGPDLRSGDDIYEWRDGRLLLVTDGQAFTDAAEAGPRTVGFSPNGRDLFFLQPAALTPDAVDATQRLYVARVGGGFHFPEPDPPCPLEACQGSPSAPPNDPTPGSSGLPGTGNQGKDRTPATGSTKKCRKGKKGRKCRKARSRSRTATTTGRAGR
jgi:hypothetical protein